MSKIDNINRAFPYQVTLSLDEDATGVLDWLDLRIGRWDMYMVLHQQTIRYCFKLPVDAFAFSERFKAREAG